MNKTLIAALAVVVCASAHAEIVYANNPAGDYFTNPLPADQGQAIGASGWYYNNVRNNGAVGIDGAYARSGDGSVHFSGTGSAKADVEYLANGFNLGGNYYATGALGTLGDLSSVGYEWFRSSGSTVASHFHPSARIMIDADGNLATLNDRGYLIYERIYNGGGVVNDSWVSDGIGLSTKLWTSNSLGGDSNGFNNTLQDFINGSVAGINGNSLIMGFSFGIGSGWGGVSDMALDNVSWTLGGDTFTSNFEVNAVPEPATMTALAVGALALIRRKRK